MIRPLRKSLSILLAGISNRRTKHSARRDHIVRGAQLLDGTVIGLHIVVDHSATNKHTAIKSD
jgi:hypothetical protein